MLAPPTENLGVEPSVRPECSLAARAGSDCGNWTKSARHAAGGAGRNRRGARRRRGAAVRPRAAVLSRSGMPRRPLCALGVAPRRRPRRGGLAVDGESARIRCAVARHYPGRWRRRAGQHHLVGDSLLHSLTLVAPRHVIVGAELAGAFAAIRPRLDPAIRCWIEGGDGLVPLGGAADGGADAPAPAPPPSLADTALLIYTSGTTGPPKAARVSHFRLMQWSHWFAGLMAVRPD